MHIAVNPERYMNRRVGNGSCALYVQRVSRVGLTRGWRRGRRVRGNAIPRHTIIATFGPDNRYPNRRNGTSHAAVYVSQDRGGIRVIDQWVGRPVNFRTIPFRGGAGRPVNDGCAYHVIIT
jgi:hypothetical protein